MTEDEMVGWHHQLNGHEFEQAPGDGEGQGKPGMLQSMQSQELDTTKQLNNKNCLELGISRMYNVYTDINRKIRDLVALLKALL